jgi:hypothetical protein
MSRPMILYLFDKKGNLDTCYELPL